MEIWLCKGTSSHNGLACHWHVTDRVLYQEGTLSHTVPYHLPVPFLGPTFARPLAVEGDLASVGTFSAARQKSRELYVFFVPRVNMPLYNPASKHVGMYRRTWT